VVPGIFHLKSGVIIRRQIEDVERRIIVILCEESQVHTLLDAARTLSCRRPMIS
jgi:hypothetical protein